MVDTRSRGMVHAREPVVLAVVLIRNALLYKVRAATNQPSATGTGHSSAWEGTFLSICGVSLASFTRLGTDDPARMVSMEVA
jgi:hypothetical protein